LTAPLPGLLLDVQRRLETLYALPAQAPVTDFVLTEEEAAAYPGGGSRTLVTQSGDQVALGVVLERETFALLAGSDPRVRLDHANLGAFCTLTEEVSHFVYLHFCARASRSVTQLELELQAEVDKFVCCVLLQGPSPDLRRRLFHEVTFADDLDPDERDRYRTANAEAGRYAAGLERRFVHERRVAEMLPELRRFYRLSLEDKRGLIARHAPR
jgi:hypothetical protein